jgi:hypothetical protein
MHKWRRDDNLVYRLRHVGWKRGKEVYENEYSITISAAHDIPLGDSYAMAQLVCDLLNEIHGTE